MSSTTPTKPKVTLLKVLAMMFQITQVFTALSLVGMMILIPRAESVVDARRGSVALFVENGSPGFYISDDTSALATFAFLSHGSAGGLIFGHGNGPYVLPDYGNITFGPFKLRNVENQYQVTAVNKPGPGVVLNNVAGTVVFHQPPSAADVLATVKWPFMISMLTAGMITIALLEFIRRIFLSVDQGAVFSVKNLRYVQAIGGLLIASWLLRALTTQWFQGRMTAYVFQHVPLGGMTIERGSAADWPFLLMGLVTLGLAEVFRQGLLLKEESSLTI